MDWTYRMNKAMEYTEAHLSEPVNESAIQKIMGCSYQQFQNSFSQITGISYLEYVRRRKLTQAAYELINTDKKIIDIAYAMGYHSDDAFRVALKSLYGLTPTEIRTSHPALTFYCQLSFEMTIKGIEKMRYWIVEKDAFQVIGVRRTTPFGGGTWKIVKNDAERQRVEALTGQFYDLGLCFGFDELGNNDYMCAVTYPEAVKGYDHFQYPKTTWLVFEAKGKISEDVLDNTWQKINHEFLPSSRFHKGPLPTIEKYLCWDDAEDFCQVEIWIPQ